MTYSVKEASLVDAISCKTIVIISMRTQVRMFTSGLLRPEGLAR